MRCGLAMLTCYAQGFALMREASKEYGYNLDLQEIARIWKGGCIIRAKVLDSIQAAFAADPNLVNLLVAAALQPDRPTSLQRLRCARW